MGNFHPLEVVGRGSETQLQVGKNLNYPTQRSQGEVGQCTYMWRDDDNDLQRFE